MRKVYIEIKSNYGNEAIYPACDAGRLFAKLTGKKTLSRSDLTTIKHLGYEVEVKHRPLYSE